MIEEPFFPFLVNKNTNKFFLNILYKLNRINDSFDYFPLVEKSHDINRALSILAEQELDFMSKRFQRKFDLSSSILNINIVIYNIKEISEILKVEYDYKILCDKQIKNVSYVNEINTFSFKVTFYDSTKVIIELNGLIEILNNAIEALKNGIRVLEIKWANYVTTNNMKDNLKLSDYVLFAKIKSHSNSNMHFELFNHFHIISELKYSDNINKLALEKYKEILKKYLEIYFNEPIIENYNKLYELYHLKFSSESEKEDFYILKRFINGFANNYYRDNANYIFKENRQFILEKLYWEDELNDFGKYGLYFLSLFKNNCQL